MDDLPEENQDLSQLDSDPEEPDSPRESVRKTKFSGVHSIKKITFTDEGLFRQLTE